MSEFTIQTDVPIPPITGRGRKSKYPTERLGVGQSYFVPENQASYNQVSQAAYAHARGSTKKFTIRRVAEDGIPGTRVWRTA